MSLAAAGRWLEPAPRRRLIYCLIALACALLATAGSVADARHLHEPVNHVRSDGLGYYAYLPSLVIDGDLDFLNQPMPGVRFRPEDAVGTVGNKWPVGVALTLLPAFLVAHVPSLLLGGVFGLDLFRPDGYSLLYQLCCGGGLLAFGAVGMMLTDALVVERYRTPGWAAFGGVVGVWLFTAYFHYYTFLPYTAHLAGSAWVAVFIFGLHRFDADAGRLHSTWPLPTAALALGMAVAVRPSSAVLAPLAAWVTLATLSRERPRLFTPTIARRLSGVVGAALLLGLLPPGAQWLNVIAQSDHPVQALTPDERMAAEEAAPAASTKLTAQVFGYKGYEGFYWTRPALVRSLFSSRHGLFFWSPLLLLSAWGVLRHRLVRRATYGRTRLDPLVCGLAIAFLAIWYLNSAWYAWWFGHTFGGRAYLDLAPLYVIGLSATLMHLPQRRPIVRWATIVIAAAAVGVHLFLEAAFLTNRISQHDYLLDWEKRTAVGRFERI